MNSINTVTILGTVSGSNINVPISLECTPMLLSVILNICYGDLLKTRLLTLIKQ